MVMESEREREEEVEMKEVKQTKKQQQHKDLKLAKSVPFGLAAKAMGKTIR